MSPYLRRDPLPLPPYLVGDHCLTGWGLGVILGAYWHVPPAGEPHWRATVRLVDGTISDCSQPHLRRSAIVARETVQAAE